MNETQLRSNHTPWSARKGVNAVLLALCAAVLAACAPEIPEQEVGDRLAASLLTELPLLHDDIVDEHVRSIGMELVEVSERPGQRYRFYVVDAPVVNAFSLPGGHIFVTRALLQRTRSSGELAGVLAHEIAHISAGHGVQRLQREMRSGSAVAAINRAVFGDAHGLLENPAAQLFDQIGEGLYSRADEREADRLAIRYMVETGFDPDSFVGFLRTIRAEEEATPGPVEWLASHPSTESRIQLALDRIERLDDHRPERTVHGVEAHRVVLGRLASIPQPVDRSAPR